MAISVDELRTRLEEAKRNPPSYGDCGLCGHPMFGTSSQHLVVEGKNVPVHEDCYWTNFGDEIDKHPIASPRHRRG